MNYSVVGSSAGIAAISARQVDFGASDVPMNARELAASKGGPVTQVPDALAAEGVAYNLNLPAGSRLHLTGPVLAGIFLGQITHWNNPAITALNPGITLPAASIAVVHRSDGSGTTYIFSNYLSSVVPGLGRQGRHRQDAELAGRGRRRRQRQCDLHSVPHTLLHRIRRASLFPGPGPAVRRYCNRAGSYVLPSTQTIAAAAAQTRHRLDRLLDRQPARLQQLPDQRLQLGDGLHPPAQSGRGQELVTMLDWLTHDGQAYAAANLYVPLPAHVRQLAPYHARPGNRAGRNAPPRLTAIRSGSLDRRNRDGFRDDEGRAGYRPRREFGSAG